MGDRKALLWVGVIATVTIAASMWSEARYLEAVRERIAMGGDACTTMPPGQWIAYQPDRPSASRPPIGAPP